MKKAQHFSTKGFSFIIPHREDEEVTKLVDEIKRISNKLKIPHEIIVTSGNHPSRQRNVSVERGSKEYLYFLDNDSKINEKSLKLAYELLLKEENVSILGGPCLLLKPGTFFELCVQATLSNKLVVGKISSRYSAVGVKRVTNDLEIILCNLIIKRSDFQEIGGFNIKLYPNEENDLVNRFLAQNKKILYHPEFYVEKPHRKNLRQFIKQMGTYGLGRAEQTKANSKKVYFYLLVLIFIFLLTLVYVPFDTLFKLVENGIFFYSLYLFYVFAKSSVKEKLFLFYLPLTTFCCHFCYLGGFLIGLLKRKFRVEAKKEIVYKLKVFK